MADHPMDVLIREYAGKLQAVYDNRTAGDFTFVGILAEFATDMLNAVTGN